jgi:hypothetical protein
MWASVKGASWTSVAAGLNDVFESVVEAVAEEGPAEEGPAEEAEDASAAAAPPAAAGSGDAAAKARRARTCLCRALGRPAPRTR